MRVPVSEIEGSRGGTCMGRYHGTGMVVGKAGSSLIAGLNVEANHFLNPSASLGQPFGLAQSSGDGA